MEKGAYSILILVRITRKVEGSWEKKNKTQKTKNKEQNHLKALDNSQDTQDPEAKIDLEE